MDNRKFEKRILIVVAAFYIIVSLFAVGFLAVGGTFPAFDIEKAEVVLEKEEPVKEEEHSEEVKAAEPSTEEASSEAAEEAAVEEKAPTEEPKEDNGVKYYSFIANNTDGRLNVRKEPSIKAKIVARMHPGDKGYVLSIGDEWTHVSVSDKQGYCSNEYLALQEIPEGEYPEELKPLMDEDTGDQ